MALSSTYYTIPYLSDRYKSVRTETVLLDIYLLLKQGQTSIASRSLPPRISYSPIRQPADLPTCRFIKLGLKSHTNLGVRFVAFPIAIKRGNSSLDSASTINIIGAFALVIFAAHKEGVVEVR